MRALIGIVGDQSTASSTASASASFNPSLLVSTMMVYFCSG